MDRLTQEIDYLVKEFHPEPLCEPLNAEERKDLDDIPLIVGHAGPRVKVRSPVLSGTQPREVLNLASYNFTGMVDAPEMTAQAQNILREYGVGSCSPPGFYGTSDMHIKLENTVAEFLKKESSIVYSQGFSTITGVIPAFCKRGDIIVADSGVNFAIQGALQLSRSTIYWYDHNCLDSLEAVLQRISTQMVERNEPLRRRFIVTEGLFEDDGAITYLPKVVELAKRFKFRIFLDESFSIGSLGRTGRGLTEHFNVSADDVDFIIGNMAISFGAGGGFCASNAFAVRHQRINGLSFIFSAAMPVMIANGATTAMHMLSTQPHRLTNLQKNVHAIRAVLDRIDSVVIPSAPESAMIHVEIRSKYAPGNNRALNLPGTDMAIATAEHDLTTEQQERLLQDIVTRALNQGVFVCRSRRLQNIKPVTPHSAPIDLPSLRVVVTSEMNEGEVAQAADILRASIVSVLGDRRT